MKCKLPAYNPRHKHLSTLKFNSFYTKGPSLFNILPKNLKSSKSLASFKNNLQKFLEKIPDNPPTPNYIGQNDNSILSWVNGSYDLLTGHLPEESMDEDVEAAILVRPWEVRTWWISAHQRSTRKGTRKEKISIGTMSSSLTKLKLRQRHQD